MNGLVEGGRKLERLSENSDLVFGQKKNPDLDRAGSLERRVFEGGA
jgi:hypothetical protein